MGTHATAVALYPNLAYKPDIDFAPIGLVNWLPVMIVARKDFPPKDLKEFVPYVKANAQKLNVAHGGVGSVGFTCGLLFNSIIGVKPTLVPFSGNSPALNALIGGQVDYMCDGGLGQSLAYVQSGMIKAYTIGAEQRSSVLPNVPTSMEAGLPEFQASAWLALFAPKGTPKPILDKLTDALDKALDDQIVRKQLLDLANEIPDKASRSQQPLAALVKSEIARWEIFPCEQQTPQALGEHRGPKSESGGQSSRRLASNRSEPPDEDRLFRLGLNNRHPPVQFQ